MPTEAWAIVGVVVGAVLGGGAQIVAGWLTDRRAHTRWLREQRSGSYLAVVEQADRAIDRLHDLMAQGGHEPIPTEHDGGVGEYLASVEVFGASEVADAAKSLQRAFAQFGDMSPSDAGMSSSLRDATEARDAYLAAVRADLGVDA